MSQVRSEVIARMRPAFRKGVSASTFIASMKAAGLSYRRTDMLADWRESNKIEKVEGLARFVRKGYVPSERVAELEIFAVSKEYMYKVKTESRLRPDAPIISRFVNILSDSPMTVEQIEQQVAERWGEWEKYKAEELVSLQTWSAFRSAR